jgi:hypothetical protein
MDGYVQSFHRLLTVDGQPAECKDAGIVRSRNREPVFRLRRYAAVPVMSGMTAPPAMAVQMTAKISAARPSRLLAVHEAPHIAIS